MRRKNRFACKPALAATKFFKMRRKLGLSQQEMGEIIGKSQQWVSEIERGTYLPKAKDILALCYQLGIEPDDLGVRIQHLTASKVFHNRDWDI